MVRVPAVALGDQPLTLSAGSMVRYSVKDYVDAAASAGFAAISVTKRVRHLAQTREGLSDADLRTMLDDRGLRVAEVEGSPDWLRGPVPDDPHRLGLGEAFTIADALGAPGVIVYHDGRPGGSAEQLVQDFGAACDLAADHDLLLALEFLPWSPVDTMSTALDIVGSAGRPNGRIVFDCWHHSHGTQREVTLRPEEAGLIFCLQVDDARAPESDSLEYETMFGRRLPGTGVLDLLPILRALDLAGVSCPVALEVYDETIVDLGADDYAQALMTAGRALLTTARIASHS